MRGPSTMPGQDGVDADVGGPELLGEALGEADDAPFGGGVGGAEGIAVAPGGRGHVDDGAAPGCLEHRHRVMRAQELPGQVDVDAAPPVGGRDLLDAAGRPGNAGIVDQRVEAAESRRARRGTPPSTSSAFETSAAACRMFRMRGAEVREQRLGHVADIDPRTMRDQHVGDGPADAGRPRRYEHPQTRLQSLEDSPAVLIAMTSLLV